MVQIQSCCLEMGQKCCPRHSVVSPCGNEEYIHKRRGGLLIHSPTKAVKSYGVLDLPKMVEAANGAGEKDAVGRCLWSVQSAHFSLCLKGQELLPTIQWHVSMFMSCHVVFWPISTVSEMHSLSRVLNELRYYKKCLLKWQMIRFVLKCCFIFFSNIHQMRRRKNEKDIPQDTTQGLREGTSWQKKHWLKHCVSKTYC